MTLQTAHTVASQLQISPEQLRHWTQDFAAQLSASALSTGFYRYTEDDVKRLQTIRDMMAEGKNTAEVSQQLEDSKPTDTSTEPVAEQNGNAQDAPAPLVIQPDELKQDGQTGMLLREVLTGFAAGQEAILNSQQANRNLMGVVIQDNFNLKDENARLRERMMKLEQELSELRQAQAEYRQQVEDRLRSVERRRDWVSRLFGS
jgi:DNA-binding transcriptional MerR regulator